MKDKLYLLLMLVLLVLSSCNSNKHKMCKLADEELEKLYTEQNSWEYESGEFSSPYKVEWNDTDNQTILNEMSPTFFLKVTERVQHDNQMEMFVNIDELYKVAVISTNLIDKVGIAASRYRVFHKFRLKDKNNPNAQWNQYNSAIDFDANLTKVVGYSFKLIDHN